MGKTKVRKEDFTAEPEQVFRARREVSRKHR
jgi:hypothetical protein